MARTKKNPAVTDEQLIAKAVEMMGRAYAPYSHFQVGAALLCADGTVFGGCNIENSAYGPTVCAERTAIFKAVSEGFRDFVKIAIVGGENGIIRGMAAPCGVCRQVMTEFCDPDAFTILLGDVEGYQSYTLRELLPLGFRLADASEGRYL